MKHSALPFLTFSFLLFLLFLLTAFGFVWGLVSVDLKESEPLR